VDPTSGAPRLGLAELLEALASDDPSVRAAAIGRASSQAGVADVLIESLADPSQEVRAAAVRALARMQGRRATDALIEVSSGDLSVLVRAEAVAALGRILEARAPSPDPGRPAGETPGELGGADGEG
jgi:HEAT repeat protein